MTARPDRTDTFAEPAATIGLGFDFDHTLGVDNGLERKALYAYAAELGRPLDDDDPDWRRRTEALLAEFRDGGIGLDAMVATFGAMLGVQGADAERWRRHCYRLVDELVFPIAGARELLARVRDAGVPMVFLTNGWTPLQQKKIARALGDVARSSPVLVSDTLHAVKPARAAFDALIDALGVPRERCWYVGDNARGDVGGALAAGLRAVWFDWEGQTYPPDLPPPTLRITALRELETLVENGYAP